MMANGNNRRAVDRDNDNRDMSYATLLLLLRAAPALCRALRVDA